MFICLIEIPQIYNNLSGFNTPYKKRIDLLFVNRSIIHDDSTMHTGYMNKSQLNM